MLKAIKYVSQTSVSLALIATTAVSAPVTLAATVPVTTNGKTPAAKATNFEDADGKHWNQWRGPQRDAQTAGKTWPQTLTMKLLWEHEKLGASYSGPITDGKRVFTTATVNARQEVVTAFDLQSGKELWKQEWAGAMMVPFFAMSNGSWIRSTPACDETLVYVVGIQDHLVCMNSETGEIRWEIDFAKKYETGNPPFGAVCSPMLDGDFLYLQAANRFFKIKKSDGSVVWETMKEAEGMSTGGSFSSPCFATLDGKRQILVQSRTNLAGVDPDSGDVMWSTPVPNYRGMNILTPAAWQNSVFTSTYNNQSFLYDVQNNHSVSQRWKNTAKGYMASPALIDGKAYLLLQNGRMACLDLESGERLWTSEKKVGDYASCVVRDQQILWLTNEGRLILQTASPEAFEIEAETELPGIRNSWAHLGLETREDGSLVVMVRALNSLHVFQWESQR